MKNENGIEMTEKEIMKESLDLLGNVLFLLFETETEEGKAAAFMADSLVKYLTAIYHQGNVLSAAADYTEFENNLYKRKKKLCALR